MSWKLTEASYEISILSLQICRFLRKIRRKTSILKLQSVKIGGGLARNARFGAPTRLVSPRVAGFPVASPYLWRKLQNLSFCYVANCESCRKSRTKCSLWCSHASCLESLVFLWLRRVYGGSCKTSPFRMCPSRLLCRFAWQAWHFEPVWLYSQNCKIGGSLARNAVFSASTRLVSSRWFSTSPCLWGKPQNLSFSNVSTEVVMSFCMAGVDLCNIPTCLLTRRK